MKWLTIGEVARITHEANRALCVAQGDTSQVPWDEAPEWQRESAMAGVAHVVDNRDAGPAASHESWLAQKKADGWKYGPVKDVERKEHPCFRPYAELPEDQRLKDVLFIAVVKAVTAAPAAPGARQAESILQFFAYEHLPEKLKIVSAPFFEMAARIVGTLPGCAERTVALRKLLEAKDAAVRAAIFKP